MTVEVLRPALTAEAARVLTDEVRRDAAILWTKIVDLYDGGAHIALDYTSWGDYWQGEFGQSKSRGDQLVRAGRVARVIDAAGLPMPGNDLQARELVPVWRQAPDELPDVWSRALHAANGQPTARAVREVVAPWRETRRPNRRARQRDVGVNQTRRLRNMVGVPLATAHVSASGANDALTEALRTAPDEDMVREWLTHAEQARHHLRSIISRLRNELDHPQQQERTKVVT